MDGDRFDDLSRKLASAVSRRQAVKGAVAGLLGAIGLRTAADAQVTQSYCGNVFCAGNPGICKSGCVCCVYSNGNSRCMPPASCTGTITPPTTTTTTAAPTTTTTTTTAAPTTTTTTTPCPNAVCGDSCCPPGSACSGPAGDICCSTAVCPSAGPGGVCCPAGNACCTTGSQCVNGCCPGAAAGTDCCEPGEGNFGGVCCDSQDNVCGTECCAAGQLCDEVNGACVECLTDGDCTGTDVCAEGVCLTGLGQTCADSAECASDTCCATGPRAGLCGFLDGEACGESNNACCSGTCIGGFCAQRNGVGEACDVGDEADCEDALTCCDNLGTGDDFICRDLTTDPNNCGTCNNVCPTGQICEGSACVCAFAECDSGCCPNETDVCIGAAGSTTCGSPQALGTVCFADDEQCASGNCARVQNISSGNVAVCCSPIGGPCNGSATTNNQCCDDGIDGTNTAGNAAACSSTGTNPGVCCVSNNFACTSLSQCCQQGAFGACALTDGVQRCCLTAGGFCGAGIRCCDGFTCSSNSCVAA